MGHPVKPPLPEDRPSGLPPKMILVISALGALLSGAIYEVLAIIFHWPM